MIDTIPGYQFGMSGISSERYPPSFSFDGSLRTCWVVGENSMYLVLEKSCKKINVFGGYGKSEALFRMNDRPKEILITYYVGIHPEAFVTEIAADYYLYPTEMSQNIHFVDSMYTEHIELLNIDDQVLKMAEKDFANAKGYPIAKVEPVIKMQIIDKYPGSRYSDMCISEIYFSDKYVPCLARFNHSIRALEFKLNKAENAILCSYSNGEKKTLYQNLNEVVWLGEVSDDKNWITVLTMQSEDQGMGLTSYLLIHTLTGKVINAELEQSIGKKISQIFLIEKDQKTFAECITTNGEEYILAIYY